MVSNNVHFLKAERIHVDLQNTLPAISESSNKLFINKPRMRTPSINWNGSDVSDEFFHNQLKPLLSTMRVFGLLPFKLPSTGKHYFVYIILL
jgi:hypothetical protein